MIVAPGVQQDSVEYAGTSSHNFLLVEPRLQVMSNGNRNEEICSAGRLNCFDIEGVLVRRLSRHTHTYTLPEQSEAWNR
jgi:hypothetical protein